MTIVLEEFDEFTARQNCGKPLLLRGRHLYSNGAQSNGKFRHSDPPADPVECARLKMEFVRAVMEGKTRTYEQARTSIETSLRFNERGAGPPPKAGWQEFLGNLKAEIESLFRQYEGLRAQLPKRQQPAHDLARKERQQDIEAALEAIQKFPRFTIEALERSLGIHRS